MIDKRYKAGSTVIREAWKYFNVNPDGKITAYRNFFQFEKGMWLQADSLVVKMADPVWPRESPFRSWIERGKPTYISGFHAFATETLAQRASQGWYEVRRVFVRGIRLVGRAYDCTTLNEPIGPIYVANELFIP